MFFRIRPLLCSGLVCGVAYSADLVPGVAAAPAPTPEVMGAPLRSGTLAEERQQALLNSLKIGDPKLYRELVRPGNEQEKEAVLRALSSRVCSIPLTEMKVNGGMDLSFKKQPDSGKDPNNGKERKETMRDFDKIGIAPTAPSCSDVWAAENKGQAPRSK